MKRLTAQWVRKAEADLKLARTIVARKLPFNDALCFHCQQAAEKYLKALLQHQGLSFPRTHDLVALLALLQAHDGSLGSMNRGLKRLTRYAVDYRYPGLNTTSRQAQAAIRLAERVRLEIRARLGIRTPPRGKSP